MTFNFIDVLNIGNYEIISNMDEKHKHKLFELKEFILFSFLLFIVIRIISRGIEIAVAFYNDVVKVNSKTFYYFNKGIKDTNCYEFIDRFNRSLLRGNGRLSLAVHTLIELIITFAILYWLLLALFSDEMHSVTIVETLLFSFSISAFNFSFASYDIMLFSIFHVIQVFLSVVLILISIAQYIGEEKLTSEENELYYEIKKLENSMREKK